MSMNTPHTAVFSPEAVAAINRAYAEAVGQLGDASQQDGLRARLAANIMALARAGETDEERLCAMGVLATLTGQPQEGAAITRV